MTQLQAGGGSIRVSKFGVETMTIFVFDFKYNLSSPAFFGMLRHYAVRLGLNR